MKLSVWGECGGNLAVRLPHCNSTKSSVGVSAVGLSEVRATGGRGVRTVACVCEVRATGGCDVRASSGRSASAMCSCEARTTDKCIAREFNDRVSSGRSASALRWHVVCVISRVAHELRSSVARAKDGCVLKLRDARPVFALLLRVPFTWFCASRGFARY